MERLRIGVIGCGLVARVINLPHLRDLQEHFSSAALCDLSPAAHQDSATGLDIYDAYARRAGLPAAQRL